MLDVGAGSGVDAAWFASRGHDVVAVEPTRAMRSRAIALHSAERIEWIDDRLPALESLVANPRAFEIIVVLGVWTHLDEGGRRHALRVLHSLLAPTGVLVLSVRNGPPPPGLLSFAVSVPQTIAAAENSGLHVRLDVDAESLQPANRAAGVRWRWLAFDRVETR